MNIPTEHICSGPNGRWEMYPYRCAFPPCSPSSWGKYPVIPHFKCFYDTIFQNSNFQVCKNFRKNMFVFIRLVFTILKLFRTKFEMHMEKQKRQIYIWIVPFVLLFFVTLFLLDFSFLFLCVYFESGSKKLRYCKHTSCEH
jgi:hypothetical protein